MRKLTHQEIAQRRTSIDRIAGSQRLPVVVVVDSVRSLYNVGSIFRTSDGVLLEKLVLAGFSPHPPRREIEKTALGATQTVPWEYVKNPADLVKELKSNGYTIACLELTDNSVPYYAVEPSRFPLCLCIGNEISGVRKELIDVADFALEIPMSGIKQSFNVAVAYGIAIVELARIWRGSRHPQSNARVK